MSCLLFFLWFLYGDVFSLYLYQLPHQILRKQVTVTKIEKLRFHNSLHYIYGDLCAIIYRQYSDACVEPVSLHTAISVVYCVESVLNLSNNLAQCSFQVNEIDRDIALDIWLLCSCWQIYISMLNMNLMCAFIKFIGVWLSRYRSCGNNVIFLLQQYKLWTTLLSLWIITFIYRRQILVFMLLLYIFHILLS